MILVCDIIMHCTYRITTSRKPETFNDIINNSLLLASLLFLYMIVCMNTVKLDVTVEEM